MGLGSKIKKAVSKATSAAKSVAQVATNTTKSVWNKSLNVYDDVTNSIGSNIVIRTIYKTLSYPIVRSFESYQRLADTSLLNLRARSPTRMFQDISRLNLKTFIPVRVISSSWKPMVSIAQNLSTIKQINIQKLSAVESLCGHSSLPSVDPAKIRRYIMVERSQPQMLTDYVTWVKNRRTHNGTNINGEPYTYYTYNIAYTLKPLYVEMGMSISVDSGIYEEEINYDVGSTFCIAVTDSSYAWSLQLMFDHASGTPLYDTAGVPVIATPTFKIFNKIF